MDNTLVTKVLNGDIEAFAELVEKYKNAVFATALSRIKDFDEAEDIAQEAFINAYMNLSKLKDRSKFSNWLYRITINLCNAKIQEKLRAIEENTAASDLISVPETPEEIYEQKELRHLIWKAMEKLGAKTREAMILFYVDDYSYQEISNYLSVSINVIKARLNYGRKRLKEELLTALGIDLKEKALDESFVREVLIELSIGFPKGFTSIIRHRDGYQTFVLSPKSKNLTKLITVTIRDEIADAIWNGQYANKWQNTFEFLKESLEAFHIRLDKVILHAEGYGEIILRKGKDIKTIRTEVGYSLLLADRLKVPLWATPEVLDQGKIFEGGVPFELKEILLKERSLGAFRKELLDNALKVRLFDLAFQSGLSPEKGINKINLCASKGEMTIGRKVIPFDIKTYRRGIEQIYRNIGNIEIWYSDDGRKYNVKYSKDQDKIVVDFIPIS